MKKYIIISGLNLTDNNRGTAALSYGAISFLAERGWLNKNQTILNIKFVKKFWKKEYKHDNCKIVTIDNIEWKIITKHIFILEKILLLKFGLLLPFTSFGRSMSNVQRVAAINGGDGFSDIYNTKTFLGRLTDIYIAFKLNIPVIQLPQTLGPFNIEENYNIAKYILKKSEHVFVRDNKFTDELQNMGIKYEITRDLSFYMKPQEWDIKVKNNSIGVDLGAGTGIISILLTAKTEISKIIGVEIQKEVAEMARRSVELNNMQNKIEIINLNIKEIINKTKKENLSDNLENNKIIEKLPREGFDFVVTNPPYKKLETGKINNNE